MVIFVFLILVLLFFLNYWGIFGVWVGFIIVMIFCMVVGFWRYIIFIIEFFECVNIVLWLGIILYVLKMFSIFYVLFVLDLLFELFEG